MQKWLKLIGLGVVAALVLGVGGSYVYINFVREPAPEALDIADAPQGAADPSVSLEGTWEVADGSQVGYRVTEVLFGQKADGVGRTSDVSGSFVITGTQVTEGEFEADLTTLKSDEDRRDGQVQKRILETAEYPTATLKLAEPLDLSSIEPDQTEGSTTATAELTVKGVTKPVTFDIKGIRSGKTIQISGAIPIVFADYNIDNPSGGPAQTEDRGLLEFAINFAKGT